jgi:hypothetical protein
LKGNQRNTASEIDETLATKRLNSQLDDPDFEPNPEDTLEDFEIGETPVIRRRNTKCQQLPTSRGRPLRKRAKR